MGDREWGMGNGERTKNNKIQFPPLTRGGLGWGETIVDTLIIPFKTSSNNRTDYVATNDLSQSSTNVVQEVCKIGFKEIILLVQCWCGLD
jgi:hypothetical protein